MRISCLFSEEKGLSSLISEDLWYWLYVRDPELVRILAHQNRTIAIAGDFRVDGAKSPENFIPQKEGVSASDKGIANFKGGVRNHNKGGCKRLLAFACVFASAFVCVCQRLSPFVCVCSHLLTPPFVAPPSAWRTDLTEIVTRNRKSLATFHRTLTSQCKVSEIASDFWGPRWAPH